MSDFAFPASFGGDRASRRSPLQAVTEGDAELGFTQISETIAAPDVELVGPLPAEIQNYTIFVAAIPTDVKQTIAAKVFLEFAGSPTASAVLERPDCRARS